MCRRKAGGSGVFRKQGDRWEPAAEPIIWELAEVPALGVVGLALYRMHIYKDGVWKMQPVQTWTMFGSTRPKSTLSRPLNAPV